MSARLARLLFRRHAARREIGASPTTDEMTFEQVHKLFHQAVADANACAFRLRCLEGDVKYLRRELELRQSIKELDSL
jgi:hypothetical protein